MPQEKADSHQGPADRNDPTDDGSVDEGDDENQQNSPVATPSSESGGRQTSPENFDPDSDEEIDEETIYKRAENEADSTLAEAKKEADTPREKYEIAYRNAYDNYMSLRKQFQQIRPQIQQLRNLVDALEDEIEKAEKTPDDAFMGDTHAGGTVFAIPPDEREEHVQDLRDRLESNREQLDQIGDRDENFEDQETFARNIVEVIDMRSRMELDLEEDRAISQVITEQERSQKRQQGEQIPAREIEKPDDVQ